MSLPYTLPVKAAVKVLLGSGGGGVAVSRTDCKTEPEEWELSLGPSLQNSTYASTAPEPSPQIHFSKNVYLLSTYCVPGTALRALPCPLSGSLKKSSCRGALGRSSPKNLGWGEEAVPCPWSFPQKQPCLRSGTSVLLHPRPQQGQGEGYVALP